MSSLDMGGSLADIVTLVQPDLYFLFMPMDMYV